MICGIPWIVKMLNLITASPWTYLQVQIVHDLLIYIRCIHRSKHLVLVDMVIFLKTTTLSHLSYLNPSNNNCQQRSTCHISMCKLVGCLVPGLSTNQGSQPIRALNQSVSYGIHHYSSRLRCLLSSMITTTSTLSKLEVCQQHFHEYYQTLCHNVHLTELAAT